MDHQAGLGHGDARMMQDRRAYLGERATAFAQLAHEHGCLLLIYGSFATGMAHQDSDIDILVDRARLAPAQLDELGKRLEALFGRKVDLVERHKLMPTLRARILAEASPIAALAAGHTRPVRPKSALFYLYIIQHEAQQIKRQPRDGGRNGSAWVNGRAKRIAHFYRHRFLPLAQGSAQRPAVVRQIHALVRISERATRTQDDWGHAAAATRRLARIITRRLQLTFTEVEADVRCDIAPLPASPRAPRP